MAKQAVVNTGRNHSVQVMVTTSDRAKLLAQEYAPMLPDEVAGDAVAIRVDEATVYQSMVGFGGAMTESAAKVISDLPGEARDRLMSELFHPADGIGLSFVRVPMGATDFALSDYTYADAKGPAGDLLAHFSTARDDAYVVPRLQQALALNPNLTIMATPWSPPAWMRTKGKLKGSKGGGLKPEYFAGYAEYFVRFVQNYARRAIPVHYVSAQNEPAYAPGYIGMTMSADEQTVFIRDHLVPAFAAAGLATRILAWDHNWDGASYARAILGDAEAKAAVAGTAWHGYGGTPAAMGDLHALHPDKDIFFTEVTEFGEADFAADLAWNARHITIGAPLNWARGVAMWNLALDQHHGPINGGAANLRGLVQVDTATGAYAKQPAFYSLGQASKYVVPGSQRIGCAVDGAGVAVAYRRPDDRIVVQVLNDSQTERPLVMKRGREVINTVLASGVTTYLW